MSSLCDLLPYRGFSVEAQDCIDQPTRLGTGGLTYGAAIEGARSPPLVVEDAHIQGGPARHVNPSGGGRARYGDHFDMGHLGSQMHPKGAGAL